MTDSPYRRIGILISFAVAGILVFCCGFAWQLLQKPFDEVFSYWVLLAYCLVALYAVGVMTEHRKVIFPYITEQLDAVGRHIDQLPEKRIIFWLTLICGAGLFAELMIIRLHASLFQLFAHFKNVSLLSCFLGLGLGYALSRSKPQTAPLAIPLFAIQIITLAGFVKLTDLNFMLFYPSTDDKDLGFFMGLYSTQRITDFMTSYGLLTFAFALNAACFIPLGQAAGNLMSRISNLRAYSYNLLGSLLGIVAFTLLSAAWGTPVSWFACFAAVMLPFACRTPAVTAFGATAACAVLLMLSVPSKQWQLEIYSPYQIVSVLLDRENPRIWANNTWFQSMLNLDPENVKRHPDLKDLADYYNLAYKFAKDPPDDVLIVGSGSGNDVASAIRNRAGYIDAVEIEPAIIAIGTKLHPEEPYQKVNVKVINDDARSYIKRTDKKYDLIVYGLLDSSTTMSGNLAGMRTDSYVWTLEAFKEARAHLKPGGCISMTVCMCPSIGPKVFRMLEEAFDGAQPIVYRTNWDAGYTYLAGENVYRRKPAVAPFPDWTNEFKKPEHIIDISTDDWPFLFIARRAYPFFYAAVLLVLLVISAVAIRWRAPKEQRQLSLPFFFLGAGFMLIEAKAITELCLVFGSTWVVTGIAIGAILLLAFAANYIVLKVGPPARNVAYLMLIASVLASLWFNILRPEFADMWTERIITTLVMTMPLFFAGLCFSSEFKNTRSQAMAMASNLMGAMLGGFVEYNALFLGYRSLYVMAALLYLLAFLCSISSAKKQAARDAGEPVAEETSRQAVEASAAPVAEGTSQQGAKVSAAPAAWETPTAQAPPIPEEPAAPDEAVLEPSTEQPEKSAEGTPKKPKKGPSPNQNQPKRPPGRPKKNK